MCVIFYLSPIQREGWDLVVPQVKSEELAKLCELKKKAGEPDQLTEHEMASLNNPLSGGAREKLQITKKVCCVLLYWSHIHKEADRLKEALSKPEFAKYLQDYIEEMQNPEVLKEQEEYLRQLEREQQESNKNGEAISLQIVVPTAVCNNNYNISSITGILRKSCNWRKRAEKAV